MSANKTNSCFPLPEFIDQNLSHSFKHQNGSDSFRHSKRPPKLYPKYHDTSFNKSSNASIAHVISFQESRNPLSRTLISSVYNTELIESYFEQCFEIISKLGEGSFGEVFKVRNREDGQYYAVKKSKQFYRSGVDRQKQLEEVRRYEQLSQHEHCITLYKAWEQEDRLYMQLELCECSLEEYVTKQKHPLSETMIWNIFLDLLLALKALHDNNLLHLDIKLDNILIDGYCTCKLGDFGLVVDLNKAHLEDATEGDSRYIAPEVLHGQFSKAADIFSLGITILELACNLDLPKNGPLWQELRCGILPQECMALLSRDFQQIIKSTMNPDPYKRPDVDTLLFLPRIQKMLIRRRKLAPLKNIRKLPTKIGRSIWQFMCNFKSRLIHLLLFIISLLTFNNTQCNDKNETKDNSLLLIEDSDNEEISPTKNTPLLDKSSMLNVVNSTPLSQYSSFRRNRKEHTRHNLDLFNLYDDNNSFVESSPRVNSSKVYPDNSSSSSVIAKRLIFAVDDVDST